MTRMAKTLTLRQLEVLRAVRPQWSADVAVAERQHDGWVFERHVTATRRMCFLLQARGLVEARPSMRMWPGWEFRLTLDGRTVLREAGQARSRFPAQRTGPVS